VEKHRLSGESMETTTKQKIKYTFLGFLACAAMYFGGCQNTAKTTENLSSKDLLKSAVTSVENSGKTLNETTTTIKTETQEINKVTPSDLKPTIEPHTSKILEQTVIQDGIVVELNKTVAELKETQKRNEKLETSFEKEKKARIAAEEKASKELRNKILGWSTLCFFGMLISAGLSVYFKGNKIAAIISGICGIGLLICVTLLQSIPIIPWIVLGLLGIIGLIYVYMQYFNKQKINNLNNANVELVKTVEATKPLMREGNRKFFFGDGPVPGVIDSIQKSDTTKEIVANIRKEEDFHKASPVTPSKYIDMNGDGIDDNTGEVIPKDSIIKIIADKEVNAEEYKKISFGGNNDNKVINLRAKIILH
jgi:ribosomal protein S17E